MLTNLHDRAVLPLRRSPWLVVAGALLPEGPRLAWLAAVLALSTLLPLAAPQLMARFVDAAIGGREVDTLLELAGAYVAVALAGQAAVVVASYAASGAAWRTGNRLRERVAAHAMHLDMTFHGRHTPGEMIERVDGDLLGLTRFISGFVAQMVGSALLLAGTLGLVWAIDARVGVALAALVALGAGTLVGAQRRVVPYAAALREETAQMFGGVEERLVAAEEIRANGAGAHVLRRFHEAAGRVLAADLRWQRRGGLVLSGTNLLFAAGTAILIAFGIVLRQGGAISLGTVVLLFQYAQMVREPVEQIVGQARDLHEAGASATRVAGLLGERPAVVWPARPRPLPAGRALALSFHGVGFAYPGDPPALREIDLEVRAGRVLGVVGRTGSGKTTLARLAIRLYDPTRGRVCLGGVDLRDVAPADLRRRASMVTQDVHLFVATVRDNVTLFDDAVDDDAVEMALESVGLGRWRRGLPDGLATQMGAGGVGVSAGEAQLLAFARVLVADPALVVLDEASSRLDPATEEAVQAGTERMLRGRTAVVIAHRPSTLAQVDDVAVMHAGGVVEHGARAQLAGTASSRFAGLLTPGGAS